MTFDEQLEAHLAGLTGEARKRSLKSFIAGAQAASFLMRNHICDIDRINPDVVKIPYRRIRRKPEPGKPQQIQASPKASYFFTGRNATV